jgi:hypothetical protein
VVAGGAAAATVAARRAGAGAKARSVISRVVEQVKDSSVGSLFGGGDEGKGTTGGGDAGSNGSL